jgi:preprotein translocase subunit SecG
VLVCLILILLVLMQLPKKDAGAGLAFGGAATDALFGAGSGNFLTKATKYVATLFFVLTILISVLQSRFSNSAGAELQRAIDRQGTTAPVRPSDTVPQVPMGELPVRVPPATTEPAPETTPTP